MAEETQKQTQLPDAEDVGLDEVRTLKEKEQTLVTLWQKRFTQSESFRRPYLARNLRMYKLYRAYRDAANYAYGTNLMPPTGFQIIETVKPRLASAQMQVNIYPRNEENIDNKEGIEKWDDLVEFDLQEMEFDDEKILWINAQLIFGNGVAQIFWEGKTPGWEIVDNWLFYPDPKAQNRLKNSRWEIKQSFKSKAVIEAEEKKRGDNPLYTVKEEKDGVMEVIPLINSIKWEKDIKDEQPTGDDPRRDRYQINTLKMGQINDGRQKKSDIDSTPGDKTDDKENERTIEIWECWDHITGKLQVVFNRKDIVRDEENPYMKVREGHVFIDLPDISLNWEYYAMGHLEPVETTIHEMADSRNQAMDDIVFSLDPIRKVKKGAGYKTEDLKHAPGATWFLNKADDVTFEKLPEISRSWVEKDNLFRREIQESLALSEYTSGIPNSGQEPSSKVEVLLMQTNIRLALIVRQLEIATTDLVNAIIEMNQEFLDEDLAMRITGKNFRFREFTQQDKEIGVDAYVTISPKQEKTSDQEAKEALEMYKLFVVDDKPQDVNDTAEVEAWRRKKNLLQKIIAEKMGYEEYVDILAPKYEPKPKQANPIPEGGAPAIPAETGGPAEKPAPSAEVKTEQAIPILQKEGEGQPEAQPNEAGKQNIMQKLLAMVAGRK